MEEDFDMESKIDDSKKDEWYTIIIFNNNDIHDTNYMLNMQYKYLKHSNYFKTSIECDPDSRDIYISNSFVSSIILNIFMEFITYLVDIEDIDEYTDNDIDKFSDRLIYIIEEYRERDEYTSLLTSLTNASVYLQIPILERLLLIMLSESIYGKC